MRFLPGLAALLILVSAPVLAQTPATMVAGSVAAALTKGNQVWCAVDRGAAFFERSGNALVARITLPDVTYATIAATGPNGALQTTYYTQPGQARLIFTSATAGHLLFDISTYADPIRRPPFVNYSQSYNTAGRQLTVIFYVQFPQCQLRVVSAYRN